MYVPKIDHSTINFKICLMWAVKNLVKMSVTNIKETNSKDLKSGHTLGYRLSDMSGNQMVKNSLIIEWSVIQAKT